MADISPAALAVYDAAHTADSMPAASLADAMAAALRTAAEQLCYARGPGLVVDVDDLLAIAAELGGAASTSETDHD